MELESEVRRCFRGAGEPQTAYEVAADIALTSKETEVALNGLVRGGSLVYRDVRSTEGSCTRLYWHGNAVKKSPPGKKLPAAAVSILQLPPSQLQSPSLNITSPSQQLPPSATPLQLQPTISPSQRVITPASSLIGMQPPSKKSRMPFKLPSQVPRTKPSITPLSSRRAARISGKRQGLDLEVLAEEVEKLREKLEKVEEERSTLEENYSEEELQGHIDKLHEYNEVKDMGQLLLGKLAEIEGTTTTALYEQFGLELDD